MESAGIRARQTCCRTPLSCGVLAGFEVFELTSENRGVPGSSPGLAVQTRRARTGYLARRPGSPRVRNPGLAISEGRAPAGTATLPKIPDARTIGHYERTELQSVVVPVGLSEADIEYIRAGYRMLAEGDPAFLDRYEPDATLVFPATLPKGGTYGNPWDALEFWTSTSELFEEPHPEPEEFIRQDDRLVVLGCFRGRSRATGERVAVRFAHVFGLSDAVGPVSEQKATSVEVFMDTAALLAALAEEPRPS